MEQSTGDRGINNAVLRRLNDAGCDVSFDQVRRLCLFLRILARWNSKLNLTALRVDSPSDETIDRLIVEPSVAARQLLEEERVVLDVGSGGGSPGLPLYVVSEKISITLVESRSRKAAFLREAAREIEAADVNVEASRVESLSTRVQWHQKADVVTMRAVSPDERVLGAIGRILRPSGRLFYFHTEGHVEQSLLSNRFLSLVNTLPLVSSNRSVLSIFRRVTS